jgi:hypothetical protein
MNQMITWPGAIMLPLEGVELEVIILLPLPLLDALGLCQVLDFTQIRCIFS